MLYVVVHHSKEDWPIIIYDSIDYTLSFLPNKTYNVEIFYAFSAALHMQPNTTTLVPESDSISPEYIFRKLKKDNMLRELNYTEVVDYIFNYSYYTEIPKYMLRELYRLTSPSKLTKRLNVGDRVTNNNINTYIDVYGGFGYKYTDGVIIGEYNQPCFTSMSRVNIDVDNTLHNYRGLLDKRYNLYPIYKDRDTIKSVSFPINMLYLSNLEEKDLEDFIVNYTMQGIAGLLDYNVCFNCIGVDEDYTNKIGLGYYSIMCGCDFVTIIPKSNPLVKKVDITWYVAIDFKSFEIYETDEEDSQIFNVCADAKSSLYVGDLSNYYIVPYFVNKIEIHKGVFTLWVCCSCVHAGLTNKLRKSGVFTQDQCLPKIIRVLPIQIAAINVLDCGWYYKIPMVQHDVYISKGVYEVFDFVMQKGMYDITTTFD